MVVDAWADLVGFACERCDHRWTRHYDLLQSRSANGVEGEYFSVAGVGVPSPYSAAGACPCPECGWRVAGALESRRSADTAAVRRETN